MSVTAESRPRAWATLPHVALDGEVVCYDERVRQLHHLNVTAAAVWNACDGTRTVGDIARTLALESQVALVEVEPHVLELVEQFVARGLCAG